MKAFVSFQIAFAIAVVALMLISGSRAQVTCSQTPEQLREARIHALTEWLFKTNGDEAYDLNITSTYMIQNGSQVIENAGTFAPLLVILEYQMLFYGPTSPIQVTPYNIMYGSMIWVNDDKVWFGYNNSFRADFFGNFNGSWYQLSNLVHFEVITFVPCSIQMSDDYIGLDPYALEVQNLQGVVRTSDPSALETVCGLIQLACPVGTAVEQYNSTKNCTDFLQSIPQNSKQTFCPYGFGNTNSSQCRLVHLNLAFVDANTHCPHLGPKSAPCTDTCLVPCNSCLLPAAQSPTGYPIAIPGSNTYCSASSNFSRTPVQSFQCGCLDGSVSRDDLSPAAGKKYCQAIPCTRTSDCRSKSGTASCVQGKCVPTRSFTWDSSYAAYQMRDMSKCSYGSNRIFKDVQGVSHCLPPGYCLPYSSPNTLFSSERASRVQCTTNQLHTYNQVRCADLSTDDYGVPPFVVEELGPRNFGCLCNRGFLGGLMYPCVCPAGNNVKVLNNGDQVCINSTQCVRKLDCDARKSCIFSPDDQDVGTCVCPAGSSMKPLKNGELVCVRNNIECIRKSDCSRGKKCFFTFDDNVGLCA